MRKPAPISFDEHVWPITDHPLDMGRRLRFADWLATHGHKDRASWIRRSCGDCQYMRDLRAGLTRIDCSTQYCTVVDPLWRVAQGFEKVRPAWWPTPPQATSYQRQHFGRIVLGELGDPRWIFDGDWLEPAWREGWLELLQLSPHSEEQLNMIAAIPEVCQAMPLFLETTCTACSRSPDRQYRRILRFPGLHGLILGPSELRLEALRDFGQQAPNLRYLQLHLTRRASSDQALSQLPQLERLRSLVVGGTHLTDGLMRFITSASCLEFLGLFAPQLTDQGVERLAELPSLGYLAIDVPCVSRAALEHLRQACPRLTIHVSGDMRDRIGPADTGWV